VNLPLNPLNQKEKSLSPTMLGDIAELRLMLMVAGAAIVSALLRRFLRLFWQSQLF
jgi:hypothetical protein